MKPNVYIHIGLHKTGTTSIQATFYQNRRALMLRDINYLGIGENHSATLYPLYCDAPQDYHMNRRAGINTEVDAARKNAATARVLRRALRTNHASRFVISAEGLSHLSPAGVERLRQALEPFAARMRVIAYVREPYSYVTSTFQTSMRNGKTYEALLAQPPRPHYRRRLSRFIDAFGRDQVDIRIFDQKRFVGGSLVADFLDALEAPPSLVNDLKIRRRNEALSLEAAWLLNEVNKRFPDDPHTRLSPGRAVGLQQVLSAVTGQKFVLPPEVYAAVAPDVAKDMQWLHQLLGEKVFTDPPPAALPMPQWNADTIATLAILINDLAKRVSVRSGPWTRIRDLMAGIARR